MVKVYTISKFWKTIIYVGGTLLLLLFIFCLYVVLNQKSDQYWTVVGIAGPVLLALIALILIGFVDSFKNRLFLHPTEIVLKGFRYHKSLRMEEIMGFKANSNGIWIVSYDKKKRTIHIHKYYEKYNEILSWISYYIPDLNQEAIRMDEEAILQNESYGWHVENRYSTLEKTRTLTTIIDICGFLLAAWALTFAIPYTLTIYLLMAFPLLCFYLIKSSEGLIQIVDDEESGYPSVLLGLLFTCMALFIRAFLDFTVFEYANIFLIALFFFLSAFIVFLIGNPLWSQNKMKKWGQLILFLLLFMPYSFGLTVSLNCILDKSKPKKYYVRILEKKSKIHQIIVLYSFRIAPWGTQKDLVDVGVTHDRFMATRENETVVLYEKQGFLGIPWVEIRDK